MGVTAYLHADDTFASDGALRDIATTHDATTATWVAKSLECPRPALPVGADRWPWGPTLRLAALAALGAGLMTLVPRLLRRS